VYAHGVTILNSRSDSSSETGIRGGIKSRVVESPLFIYLSNEPHQRLSEIKLNQLSGFFFQLILLPGLTRFAAVKRFGVWNCHTTRLGVQRMKTLNAEAQAEAL
jgi:hypothetical protein